VTDAHFARAAQNEAHEGQKEGQQASAVDGMGLPETGPDAPENAEIAIFASAEGPSENAGVGDEGIEPSTAALRVRCSAS
jgi:hypothetical protein